MWPRQTQFKESFKLDKKSRKIEIKIISCPYYDYASELRFFVRSRGEEFFKVA
jgi:hypothetical protein